MFMFDRVNFTCDIPSDFMLEWVIGQIGIADVVWKRYREGYSTLELVERHYLANFVRRSERVKSQADVDKVLARWVDGHKTRLAWASLGR